MELHLNKEQSVPIHPETSNKCRKKAAFKTRHDLAKNKIDRQTLFIGKPPKNGMKIRLISENGSIWKEGRNERLLREIITGSKSSGDITW
jgi:hypothetical protein